MCFNLFKLFQNEVLILLGKGFVVLIMFEDDVEIVSMICYYIDSGFKQLVFFVFFEIEFLVDVINQGILVDYDMFVDNVFIDVVNVCIEVVLGIWMYYCYNVEYLFYLFCEYCGIGEMLVFYIEECWDLMLIYVVDFYVSDLD